MKLTKKQIQTRRKWADALQTSTQIDDMLYEETRQAYCCLGVYAHQICGIDNKDLLDRVTLDELDDINVHAMRRKAGLDIEGDEFFIKLNDGFIHDLTITAGKIPAMTHADIGLYLYLTCEAGEAFEYYNEDHITNSEYE